MEPVLFSAGTGRTRVSLTVQYMGKDILVCLFNEQAHLGAVAVAEYSEEEDRASTSVITRYGHKDDAVAYRAAHGICKKTKKPVCVIAGIHLDGIKTEEINRIIRNCDKLVARFSRSICS